jgi:Spy/CpxP family protein refolding chaperone
MIRPILSIVAIAMLLGVPTTLQAAEKTSPVAGLKSAVDDLKLAGEAKTKADKILDDAQADVDKAIQAGDRTKVAKIVHDASDQVIALLDEDQKLMLRSKILSAGRSDPAVPENVRPGRPGAAAGGRGGAAVGQRIKQAVADLKLSDEQISKVDAVIADLEKKAQDLRAAGRGPEMREKIMALREDMIKQMKAILTEAQFKGFQEKMQQSPGGGAGGGRIGAAVGRFEQAVKSLDLTDDQKPKVEKALADARKKFAELGRSVQGGQAAPDTREKFRSAMEDLRTELMAVLTPEQREKLKSEMEKGQRPAERARPNARKPAEK